MPPDEVSERFATEITPLVYDLQFRPDAPDVAFWVEWCREVGGPVLELGCGTGRVSLALARAGAEVVGVDLSEPMLRVARERLARDPEEVLRRVRFVRGDMREPVEGCFACAIIPASTFGVMLTECDQRRLLSAVQAALAPGGRLAFDLPAPGLTLHSTGGRLPPVRRTSEDGTVDFEEERLFEPDAPAGTHTFTITYTFYRPAHLGRVVERLRGRVSSPEQVEEALRARGFRLEQVWGGYDRSAMSRESRRLVFVARRG